MDRILSTLFITLVVAMMILVSLVKLTSFNIADHPVYRLSFDLSGGDASVLKEISSIINTPPTEPKDIGFYGGANYPERARIYLGAMTKLTDRGFLYSTEDKYIVGLFVEWQEKGLIDREALSKPSQEIMDIFIDGPGWTEEPTEQERDSFAQFLEARYGKFVAELEDQIKCRGEALLSVDATGGDTMYFAIVTPKIASKWREKAFSQIPLYKNRTYINGIRSPMWDDAWHKLVYAYLLPVTKPTYTRPVPDGVRLRSKNLLWVR